MGEQGRKSAEMVSQIRAAKKSGDVSVLAAVAADQDVKPPLRLSAIKALVKAGDRRAVKPLSQITTDSHIALRIEAIKAIGELGGKDGARPLITALETLPQGKVAIAAAGALAKRKDVSAVPALVGVLHDTPNWKLKKTVALALSRIGRDEGLQALSEAADKEPSRGKRKVLARYAEPSKKR